MRMITSMLVGWALSCGCADGKRLAPPSPAGPATMTAPADAAVERDQAVIEAALADLLTLTDSPLVMQRGTPPAEIRFAERPAPYRVTEQAITQQHEKEKWAALSERDVDAVTEAAREVVRRHENGEGFKPFRPRDPRVKIEADPTTTTTTPATRRSRFDDRPVRAWPPGYTAEGQYAVVFLTIPWSMHSAETTYLLKRDGNGWRILLRQFVYYV